jgi:RNA polymerase sigma factor (TIGR02999 family)
MNESPGEVTLLLRKIRERQSDAVDQLIRLVYPELRRIASACMRDERPGLSLQPTALIHEAWLRLAGQSQVEWRDRAHFFGLAARMMRRILVDHARARLADKRGAGAVVLSLDWVEIDSSPRKLDEIVAVDEALERLRQLDPRQAQIVEMHYFAGMTVRETAEALGISPRTVDREWAFASAWLRRELAGRSRT